MIPITRSSRLLLLAGILAFALKLALASSTGGTNDVRTWEYDSIALRTTGFAELYRSGVQYPSSAGALWPVQAFIHPPAVLRGLQVFGALQDVTGWPLRFWLRAACALADAGTFSLLWCMFGDRVPLLVVLAPISILISGFHGNTDPIMMFFVAAAVFYTERRNPVCAGAAFGLACSVKLIPMIFAPAILLCLPGLRPRLKWVAASAVVWIAFSLPYLVQEPMLILRSMLGYGSSTGLWGFSLISTVLGAGRVYDPAAKWIAIVGAVCAGSLMRKRPLFAQCGLVAFSFLFLSPGFGLQYLAWTVPWTLLLPRRSLIVYHAVAGAFALTAYATASQNTRAGLYSDMLNPVHFPARALLGAVCWMTIAVITYKEITSEGRNPAPPTRPGDPENIG